MPSQNVEPLVIATGVFRLEVTHCAEALFDELPQLAEASEAPVLLSSRTRRFPLLPVSPRYGNGGR